MVKTIIQNIESEKIEQMKAKNYQRYEKQPTEDGIISELIKLGERHLPKLDIIQYISVSRRNFKGLD